MGHGELLDLMMYDGLQDPYTGRHMGEIGEANVARNGLTREEQDAIALRSYQLAQAAVKDGIFKDEIVPVIKTVRGTETVIDTDEEPFRVDFDKLSKLKTVFKKMAPLPLEMPLPLTMDLPCCFWLERQL